VSGFPSDSPEPSNESAGFDTFVPSRPQLFIVSPRERNRLILGSLAFALVFFYPIFGNNEVMGPGVGLWLNRWPHLRFFDPVPGYGDRDVFTQLRWVAYYTLTHFHQIPFWNPYKCGGMTLIGNPEGAVFTPFLLFYMLFGLMPGVILEVYLHLAIMFAGGYLLGRELDLGPPGCLVLAAMFPSSSWLPLHVTQGHLNFLSIAYVPWILALLLSSCRTRRWYPAILGGLLCGLTLLEGNYGFVFAAMLVAIVAFWYASILLSIRPLVAAFLIGAFALAFSALKLVPTAEMLTIYPRDWGPSYLTWPGLLASIFSRNQDLTRPITASFQFTEYGGYLGAPFLLLAVIGALAGWRKSPPWVFGTVFFLFAYRGDTSPNAVTMWLRLLPLGGNIGLCGRWVIPLVFCVGVLAALGAQFLFSRRQKWVPRLGMVLVAVGLVDAWLVCSPDYRYYFQGPAQAPPFSQEFRQFWAGEAGMTALNQANLGAANCYCCGYYIHGGKVIGYNQPGYRGEYYLLGSGQVQQIQWTPNRLTYDVNVPAATSLVINQNIYPGWRVAYGDGEVYPELGQLAVHVPPGHQRIELLYRPRRIIWAFALTVLATIALIAVWRREIRGG
jgi:hypothetical protein